MARTFRIITPGTIVGGALVTRTILASYPMINSQNMIDEHFSKTGVFEVHNNK